MQKISIIIPVYNAEKYVEKAIRSALAQDGCEIIVVDDGSADNSGAICDTLASDRVRVLHIENSGPSVARNLGLSLAKGEYICFMDSDDYIDDGTCEYMLSVAQKTGADIVMCGFYTEYEGAAPNPVCVEKWQGNALELGERFIDLKRLHLLDSSCNKLYRKEFLDKNSLRFPEGEIFEDTDFNIRVFEKNPHLVISDKCFYHYMQRRSGSITKTYHAEKLPMLMDRADTLYEFCKKLCPAATGYCGIYFLKSLFSCIADTFMPTAEKLSRRALVRKYVNDSRYSRALGIAKAYGSDKIILLIAKTKNISIILLFAYCTYIFKYYVRRLLSKLR